ncbi:DUF3558 family protein [Actinosynnema sp. NPDC020468]|uniref:DUF3558 family protein n=1 Tax=Actinosynnema sp. NPDC020468 TaxID=3154488 RepID=UPI0034038786
MRRQHGLPKHSLPIACLAAAALLAACGTERVAGRAAPAERVLVLAPTAPSAADRVVDLCGLLTAQDVATIGLDYPGESRDIGGGALMCTWNRSRQGGLSASTVERLDQLNLTGEKSYPARVGRFEAVKVEAPQREAGGCAVAIVVSEDLVVLLLASLTVTSTDTAAACVRVDKAAELVAPKLP